MTLEDIYTAALLAALFVFSVAVTRLINRRGKSAKAPLKRAAGDSSSPLSGTNDENVQDGPEGVAKELKVTFSKSGRQYPWDPAHDSLLEFAESLGIDIDFSAGKASAGVARPG